MKRIVKRQDLSLDLNVSRALACLMSKTRSFHDLAAK